jgi:hypothetical protein
VECPYPRPSASGSSRENGTIESFNGKLRDELLNREILYTLPEARILIEQWRRHHNGVRPHSALGYRPPAPVTIAFPYWLFHIIGIRWRLREGPYTKIRLERSRGLVTPQYASIQEKRHIPIDITHRGISVLEGPLC